MRSLNEVRTSAPVYEDTSYFLSDNRWIVGQREDNRCYEVYRHGSLYVGVVEKVRTDEGFAYIDSFFAQGDDAAELLDILFKHGASVLVDYLDSAGALDA